MNKYLIPLFIFCGTNLSTFIHAMEKEMMEVFTLDKKFKFPDELDPKIFESHNRACLSLLKIIQTTLGKPTEINELKLCKDNLIWFQEICQKTKQSKEVAWKSSTAAIWQDQKTSLEAKVITMVSAVRNIHKGFYCAAGNEFYYSNPATTWDKFQSDKFVKFQLDEKNNTQKSKDINTLFETAIEINLHCKSINRLLK